MPPGPFVNVLIAPYGNLGATAARLMVAASAGHLALRMRGDPFTHRG